jgi:hypothetical protein
VHSSVTIPSIISGIALADNYGSAYIDVHASFACVCTLRHKSHRAFMDGRQRLRFHDVSHGVALSKKTFSLAVLWEVNIEIFHLRQESNYLIFRQCREHRLNFELLEQGIKLRLVIATAARGIYFLYRIKAREGDLIRP